MRLAWILFGAVALVATALQAAGDGAFEALRYERNAILDGQVWRALTGHLVHLNWEHLAWNLAGGAAVTAIVGRFLSWKTWLLCALGVSAGLFLFALRLHWYVGLSGVLYGLLVYGALRSWRKDKRNTWLILVGAIFVKIAVEMIAGDSLSLDFGAPVIVGAHLAGAVTGALCTIPYYLPRGKKPL